MNRATWLLGCTGFVGIFAVQACTSDDPAGPPGSNAADGGASTNVDGATAQEGGSGTCILATESETFGLTDSTKFATVVRESPTSLPANARANSGRLVVDGCGLHLLAALDGDHSIHSATPGGSFTRTSTTDIEDLSTVVQFRKIGPDFAVVATNQDNKTYLYRMAAGGGPITKVVSSPLINGDFGAQSIAVSPTHLFFNNYKAGPSYELRRATIAAFGSGTIPLEEPLTTDSADNAKEGVYLWGNLVAYGFKHYAQDCTPAAGTGCTAETTTQTPNLRYVFAGQNDALYGWAEGKLIVRTKAMTEPSEVAPSGITTTMDEGFIAGSVSPDGQRAAVVTRGSQGLRLLRISGANTSAPSATAFTFMDVDNDRIHSVWTNGKVVLAVWARSGETKPLAVQGIAWP